jgi:hypothetical protein
VTSKKDPGDIDAILIVGRRFNAVSKEAMLLRRSKELYNVHLFAIPENDREEINSWLFFFGHDRDGHESGLVEIQIT